jgi:hypothetical protein
LINWMDVMVAQQMRKDALARAAKERFVRQALGGRARGRRPWARERYRLWMAQLGDRLMAWGQRLKAQYAPPEVADAVSCAWGPAQQCYEMRCGSSGC